MTEQPQLGDAPPPSFSINRRAIDRLYSQIGRFFGEFPYIYRNTTLNITINEDTSWAAHGLDATGSRLLGTFFKEYFKKDILLDTESGSLRLERVSPNSYKSGTGRDKVSGICIAEILTIDSEINSDLFFQLSLQQKLRSSGIWNGDCEFADTSGGTIQHIPITIEGQRFDLIYLNQENDIWIFSSNNKLTIETFATKCFVILELIHFLVGFDFTGQITYGSCALDSGMLGLARRVHGREIPERYNSLIENPLDATSLSICLDNCIADADGFFTFVEYIRLASRCPLEVRGAMFAIALEVLTDIHSRGKKAEDLTPIKQDDWDKLRTDIFINYEAHRKIAITTPEAPTEGWEILRRKLDTANQPTNSDKLSKPFKDMGIVLSKSEKKAISYRNRLLHSGRIFKSDKRPDDYVNAIINIEANLFMLCAKLFLRRFGYSGQITDWTKGNKDVAPDPSTDFVIV